MFERRSLRWPITLGVTLIVLIIVIIVGWVLLAVFGAMRESDSAALYWTLLSVGSVILVAVLVGVVMYLTLTIKAINLNQRQSNFVDSVTHELKSPIASLKLYLQTLHRRQVSADERDNFHRFMLEDVERLDQLINHLLEAGRLDKPPSAEEIEAVEMATLLDECAESVCLRYRVPETTVQAEHDPCTVLARRVDLDMIFRNLIDNAVKYAGEQPQVEIKSVVTGNRVTVRISDNGRGIPLAERRKIFSRFVRLGLELERDKPGTGLGLYIVRTLVRRLKGRVRVRGRDPGPGTVFEVQLPAQGIDAAPGESTKREARAEVA